MNVTWIATTSRSLSTIRRARVVWRPCFAGLRLTDTATDGSIAADMRSLALVLVLVTAPAALAVDCGRLPTGQNPSWQELDAEIARASAAHGVPTEIIKGVS